PAQLHQFPLTRTAMRRLAAVPVLAVVLLATPPADALPEAEYTALNQRAVEQHVRPRYEALAGVTVALAANAKAFCASPADETLSDLQRSYHAATDAWQDVQHIRFGPVELFFRSQRIAFWPDQRN